MPETTFIAPETKRLLTARDVAELLGLTPWTVYKWARTGRIPCIKFQRHTRFKLADIERWEKQHTTGKF